MMKLTLNIALAMAASTVWGLSQLHAADVIATTPSVYSGTVASVNVADSTVMVGETGVDAVAYRYTPDTVFVNAAGEPVSYETITPSTPVDVTYTVTGDMRTADRVVIRQPVVQPVVQTTTVAQPAVVTEKTTTTRVIEED